MAINVANTGAALSGDTLITTSDNATVTGLITFSRGASAPFAVLSTTVVTSLNADLIDGLHAADIVAADAGAVKTITAVWTFSTNPVFNANAIPETAIADGSVLARLAANEVITGLYTFNSRSVIKAGSAASLKAGIGGVIYSQTGGVGNVGAGEDTLYSQAIAADVLAANGDAIEIEMSGLLVDDAGTKTLRLKWGGTTFHTGIVTTNSTAWSARVRIARTGAAAQVIGSTWTGFNSGSTQATAVAVTGETLSGAVTFAVTGEGVNNNDIVMYQLSVKWFPVNV